MSKSVCIVGAGPSGIIAAKTFLYNHQNSTFKVTVFEQSENIGGLWPLSSTDNGMVNPGMCTNLSRHTVSFSDMAWPESSPAFPKAWQVGQYLKSYVSKYNRIDIRTSSKVVKASRLASTSSSSKRWKIEIEKKAPLQLVQYSTTRLREPAEDTSNLGDAEGETQSEWGKPSYETHHFDYLIIASGFFGKPNLPCPSSNLASFTAPVQHSTQFRDAEALLQGIETTTKSQGRKILVVGGSMSGAEVAASIAMQLSSCVHSQRLSQIKDADKWIVHHVVRRPFWIMPLFLPVTPILETDADLPKKYDPAPNFLPLDLVMYSLANRPPGQMENNSGHVTRERAIFTNEYLKSVIGTDQTDLVDDNAGGHDIALAMRGDILNEAPWLTISDTYAEFVRSGRIIPTSGKLVSFKDDGLSQSASVVVSTGTEERVIGDIAAVVLATGFEATSSLSFFPKEILQSLNYDPECSPFPLALDLYSTVHHDIPDLGFVGFYKGPFWGVMEMQARFLRKLWTGDERAAKALNSHISPITDFRKCYYNTPKELGQFPMGDYPYLMESFREMLGFDIAGEPRKGPVLPARYVTPNASDEEGKESTKALLAVGKTHEDSTQRYKFVARAIFRSLQGDWRLQRSLVSSIATYPSGNFRGTAKFFPRYPDPGYDAEYLYFEEGDFETEQGLKFRANRRYAHRYLEATDTLSVWFVKPDNKSIDYLFHELEIIPPDVGSGWRARAHHLCIADTYDVKYEFRFRGANIKEWTLSFSVKGPNKDYSIESLYQR